MSRTTPDSQRSQHHPDPRDSADPRRTAGPAAWILGLGALLWLILRTGRKPSRFTYPCQQAAMGHAALFLGLPLLHACVQAYRGRRTGRGRFAVLGLTVLGVLLFGFTDTPSVQNPSARLGLQAPTEYFAEIHVVEEAGGPDGDHHLGVDELLACMGNGGLKFYQSSTIGPESGPDGVVGADDVVLIKINAQWPERGGTNTDVLKGIIARIVEHPDGFNGEVVVVENTQGVGSLDWPESNAEDHGQSTIDVVNHFAGMGWPVSAYLWDTIRTTSVAEYVDGDVRNGYVVGPWNAETQIRVSYPKFQTAEGTRISLLHGIWDQDAGTYDNEHLKFINVPVLKCHGAVYGVTACVKHHVGTMTTALNTNTHAAVRYGGLGSFMAEGRMPDLQILDCIYILARPSAGPWCTYEEATRVDKLVAGLDPVAIDLWATINILVPTILANGYTNYPMQDPENPGSIFRIYLDNTTSVLLDAGIEVTNDPSRIIPQICGSASAEESNPDPVTVRVVPNPFTTETRIVLRATSTGTGRLEIFDARGRLHRSLPVTMIAGQPSTVRWDGRDAEGQLLPAGVYGWRLVGAGVPVSGSLVHLR